MNTLSKIFARLAIGMIRAYQYLFSPWLGPRCRYSPSCSEYAVEALRLHGAAHGGWLTIKRLARCHPWATFGYDPVPTSRPDRHQSSVPE